LSLEEIAARMGVTLGAVKSHLSRARQKVHAEMHGQE
jgi:DNA-directed RNA polymerase specialized sigma24 family protein